MRRFTVPLQSQIAVPLYCCCSGVDYTAQLIKCAHPSTVAPDGLGLIMHTRTKLAETVAT